MVIGIPAGSFAREAPQRDDSHFFVVLRPPQDVFQRQPNPPVKGLRLGPQLGAGASCFGSPMPQQCPCGVIAQPLQHVLGQAFVKPLKESSSTVLFPLCFASPSAIL